MGLAPRATAPDASSREAEGGIRDDGSLAAALATGCARVALGTAALERPDWVRAIARRGDRIAVGLDVRGTTLSAGRRARTAASCLTSSPGWMPTGVSGTCCPTSAATAQEPVEGRPGPRAASAAERVQGWSIPIC